MVGGVGGQRLGAANEQGGADGDRQRDDEMHKAPFWVRLHDVTQGVMNRHAFHAGRITVTRHSRHERPGVSCRAETTHPEMMFD